MPTCTCVVSAFGEGPFGSSSFGAGFEVSPGSALPYNDPFDIFCLGCCGTFLTIFDYPEVTYYLEPGQILPDGVTEELLLRSGGGFSTKPTWVQFDVPVPQGFTLEVDLQLQSLPDNFGSIATNHLYIGVTDAQGASVGLFISKIGILYTGAVHFVGDTLVADHSTQALPDSAELLEEGGKYVIRLVASYDTGTAYVYWTKREDVEVFGHQLRYVLPILPSIEATQVPTDGVLLSARGTLADPGAMSLASLCLGTGLIIPNIIPVADAGVDQAVRTCAVVQLDGTGSFDPEGANLTYAWRLLDTPLGSQYVWDGFDGQTFPNLLPTGFSDKFYSVDLAVLDGEEPISAGDVLIVNGAPSDIVATGSDGNGFFVQLAEEISDSIGPGVAFKLVRQNGISGRLTAKPTFLPDKPGLYRFDLTVFDGGLFSEPSVTVINVTESPIPRGLTPDVTFLWNYLSDFWGLIEDKERIEVYWSGLAQIAASELLNLWQLDYSKSLRDVQRTFQRRWLRYDLMMEEDPVRIERTSIKALFGGVVSTTLSLPSTAGVLDLDINGTLFQINLPALTTASAAELATNWQPQLDIVDSRLTVTPLLDQAGNTVSLRLNAPFGFRILSSSTLTLFPSLANDIAQGTGVLVNERAYRVDTSLDGVPLQAGDLFVLDGIGYRIARVSTDAFDGLVSQRVTTIDPMPTTGNLLNWKIGGTATAETLDFWHGCVSADDHVFLDIVNLETGDIVTVEERVIGANEQVTNKIAVTTGRVGTFLLDPAYSVHFRSVLRRHYLPVDRLVQDVPYLQEKIKNKDDTEVLRRNVDFFIEAYRNVKVLRFIVGQPADVWQNEKPPTRLWAETTYLDNRPLIEANFGIPAAFTLDDLSQLPSNVDYLSAVRGLWFAYFNGPTLFNVRAGVQILLGLPFAEEAGVIEEIRDDFTSKTARILVRDAKNNEVVRSYTYPAVLDLERNPSTGVPYKVGDSIAQFAPIVQGSEVVDWVKDPKWIEGYINQGTSFEIEKFFKFLVRVNADVFNLSALLFAQQFVKRIKPTYTFPIFIVQRKIAETEVSVSDAVTYDGKLTLWAGPWFQNPNGQAQMWDQPRPGGGGYWGHADQGDPNTPVTYPNASPGTDWVGDQYLLAPEQVPVATLRTTAYTGGPGLPVADSIFYAGLPVFTDFMYFASGSLRWLYQAGTKLDLTKTCTTTATFNKVALFFRGVGNGDSLQVRISKNGVVVETLGFIVPTTDGDPNAALFTFNFTVSVPVIPGDTLEAEILDVTQDFNTFVEVVGVIIGAGEDWFADVNLPAGTYHSVIPL